MRIICLMPTWGRKASLLNNSIACFLSQTHKNKDLVIYDDLGTLEKTYVRYHSNVHIVSRTERATSIGAKYNYLLDLLNEFRIHYDAVAVIDDDDVYLPEYLSSHAEVLKNHAWSKPTSILSAYFDPPQIEDATGRFHGSIAIRKDLVTKCPWIDTTRATFDQEYLAALTTHSLPGNPAGYPQYVYRWGTSQAGHCSGLMGNPDWYKNYTPDSTEPIPELGPQFDEDTLRIKAFALQSMSTQPERHLSQT